jgi:AcrR family transcriptional regulator
MAKGLLKKEACRRERKKKITREAIYRSAQKLFAEKGFENTSVEDVTEQVDIAQSTFFNYFPRKEDILIEIFQRKLPFLKRKCREILQSNGSIKTKIHEIFSNTAKIAGRSENIIRAILINSLSTPPHRQRDSIFFDDFRKTLALVLQKGQQEGCIRRDIPSIKLANMLEGIFTLFVIDCFIKKGCTASTEELFDRLNICLEGMLINNEQMNTMSI